MDVPEAGKDFKIRAMEQSSQSTQQINVFLTGHEPVLPCAVPLFHEKQILNLKIKGIECEAQVLYESRNKIVVSLESDLVPGNGDAVEGSLQQGNYLCSFQTKIQNLELTLRDRRWVLDLAYPVTFKRSLSQQFRKS